MGHFIQERVLKKQQHFNGEKFTGHDKFENCPVEKAATPVVLFEPSIQQRVLTGFPCSVYSFVYR
jgi:hypothetical protein